MTVRIKNKLNLLGRELAEGLLVDAAWLERRGYSRSLRSQYVAAGWLKQPARGVYCRPRGVQSWEQVIISLQALLQFPVSVGGRTALELQGHAHYLSQSPEAPIHLYSDKKLPRWASMLSVSRAFESHNRHRFLPEFEIPEDALSIDSDQFKLSEPTLPGALRVTRWGQWNWPLVISTPERAILELIDELPQHETFHLVDMLMEGLVNISPRRMQSLLEQTKSVKVKRLFFFFAERHHHRWLDHIAQEKVDLGKGKRMLVKGGKLDPKFQITVPEDLNAVP